MTTNQILDKVLPYTRDEMRCGMKKKVKQAQRIELATKINDYLGGKEVDLPGNVKILLSK
jgi:hypothetical protein